MAASFEHDWGVNASWIDLNARIAAADAVHSRAPMRFDDGRGAWRQECAAEGATQTVLLQNRHVAIDVTDHGVALYPLLLDGRIYARVSFAVGEGPTRWHTHAADGDASDGVTGRALLIEPGRATLTGIAPGGAAFEAVFTAPPSFPFLHIELSVAAPAGGPLPVAPEVCWPAGVKAPVPFDSMIWLHPRAMPVADPVLARNPSTIADPQRPGGLAQAGLGIALLHPATRLGEPRRLSLAGDAVRTLADRRFPARELETLFFPPVAVPPEAGVAHLALVLGAASDPAAFARDVARWSASEATAAAELGHWGALAERFAVRCGDPAVERQAAFSLHNSLFSRSLRGGRTIFIHGRRDRGMGDCAKVHQSAQMHVAALAAGEAADVRAELVAYAGLQDAVGGITRQLRPGRGAHPYAGSYSNATFLLAVHRYLAWTGDLGLLAEPVAADERGPDDAAMGGRVALAADWLLARRTRGVMEPCGWVDGWPRGVLAQGQISAVSVMALRAAAGVCAAAGRRADAARFRIAAADLAERTVAVFYDPATGLFGEHLFASGEVAGRRLDDFWSVTQIWAALAGLAPDARGLDACRDRCLTTGMRMAPESVMAAPYMARFEDGVDALGYGNQALWTLAAWPELTHLYALAEVRANRPDPALAAIRRQLPERINGLNPHAAPHTYPEKYIHPGTTPWLCTWAGDPTLLHVILDGFAGVEADLDGMWVRPRLPEAWRETTPLSLRYQWRGRTWNLTVTRGECAALWIDGREVDPDAPIRPEGLPRREAHAIRAAVAG